MCKINDVGLLGLDDECCGDDPGDCDCEWSTVEGDLLKAACDGVTEAANFLKEVLGEYDQRGCDDVGDDLLIMAKYMDLQQAVAEVTQQLVTFMGPDAGIEDTR